MQASMSSVREVTAADQLKAFIYRDHFLSNLDLSQSYLMFLNSLSHLYIPETTPGFW